jgi:hypothetical protein
LRGFADDDEFAVPDELFVTVAVALRDALGVADPFRIPSAGAMMDASTVASWCSGQAAMGYWPISYSMPFVVDRL